ncbi:extra-large guanine nucleotide-binding protein 3-like isoform X1 [Panicum miliaceum]|uniref:Extra-large guanine nucleotide-binding protein 3-like isoform X1 n=1 Tax=Panicum miliaceum TaxID=4540 RepID=A0A3L6THW7_PANMI|nr:extra-large guanine nucleotide-binding protein 3-like isoform X1 [Panicum miliaceum]
MDTAWARALRRLLPPGAPLPDEDHLDYSFSVDLPDAPAARGPPSASAAVPCPLPVPLPRHRRRISRLLFRTAPAPPPRCASPSPPSSPDAAPTPTSLSLSTSPPRAPESPSPPPLPQLHPPAPAHGGGGRRRACARCGKGGRIAVAMGILGDQRQEECLACGARYCAGCVLRAMGSMPEGRKCVTCIGAPVVDPRRRARLGRGSRLLARVLAPEERRQVMRAERGCAANQVRPDEVVVNGRGLSQGELDLLLGCAVPPDRLVPGQYWYDKDSGLWGKEGERPDRIVSSKLSVGGKLQADASNGTTQVFVNGREITKTELRMLKHKLFRLPPSVFSMWHAATGYRWPGRREGRRFRVPQTAVPSDIGTLGTQDEPASLTSVVTVRSAWLHRTAMITGPNAKRCSDGLNMLKQQAQPGGVIELDPRVKEQEPQKPRSTSRHRLVLLLTFFQCQYLLDILMVSKDMLLETQAKFLYGSKFSPGEILDLKLMIQINVYKYLSTLLEWRECFEDEALKEERELCTIDKAAGETGVAQTRSSLYSLNQRLMQFADWLLEIVALGDLDAFFPAATREYAPIVQEVWKDAAIQATHKRNNEFHFLPDVASYFLDRVAEISSNEYEPTQTDILYAEGINQWNGLSLLEFSLDDRYTFTECYVDKPDDPSMQTKYQLIRINSKGLNGGLRCLEMLEEVRAIIFCISLADYDQMWVQSSGEPCNKMISSRDMFEDLIKHPSFQDTTCVLLLNKYDTFEAKINRVPLTVCDWFADFSPVKPHHTYQSLASHSYYYVALKFKDLYSTIANRKLFVFQTKALERKTVDAAFRYIREVLRWDDVKNSDAFGSIDESLCSMDMSSSS